MSPLRRGFPLRRLDDNQDAQETRPPSIGAHE